MPLNTSSAETSAKPPKPEGAAAVSLRERITDELAKATKDQNAVRLSTLRLILAAVRDRDIAKRATDCTTGCEESEITAILVKMAKQRDESSKIYDDAGRPEMAEREREEIAVIREFLPVQLEKSALKGAVQGVVDELGASGLKDMGRCMDALKTRYPGRIDVPAAAAEVKKLLS
jgi:uncharacterized protein YqeY